jgi:hypothetical protein
MGIAQKHPLTATKESILDLVRILPPEKRRTLSVELAPRSDVPAELMRFLAQDEIIIAEPVILQCNVLTEDDLCAIATNGSPAHVSRLRQRPNLPEKVCALLAAPKVLEPRLLEPLRKGNVEQFQSVFSEAVGGGAQNALEALAEGKGAPLAKACKAAGISRAAYSTIVLLFDAARARAPEATESLLNEFDAALAA